MFSVHCPGCDKTVLLTPRRILSLDNTDHGIVIAYRCWAGHEGVLVTGRGASTAASSVPQPAAA
jgi:hypothetical protein